MCYITSSMLFVQFPHSPNSNYRIISSIMFQPSQFPSTIQSFSVLFQTFSRSSSPHLFLSTHHTQSSPWPPPCPASPTFTLPPHSDFTLQVLHLSRRETMATASASVLHEKPPRSSSVICSVMSS